MRKIISIILAVAVALSIIGCSGEISPKEVSASTYMEQLYSALEAKGYPLDKYQPTESKQQSDAELGDYLYTGYILADGVYAATYESLDRTELLRVHIMIDWMLASGDSMAMGGFAMGHMVSCFDPSNAKSLSGKLDMNNVAATGIREASGSLGTYKLLMNTPKNIFLIHTFNSSSEE